MTFSTLNTIYGLEIVQARGMWFVLPNISSSFVRLSLYFMLTFFWLFIYLLGGHLWWSQLPQGEPIALSLNQGLSALLRWRRRRWEDGIGNLGLEARLVKAPSEEVPLLGCSLVWAIAGTNWEEGISHLDFETWVDGFFHTQREKLWTSCWIFSSFYSCWINGKELMQDLGLWSRNSVLQILLRFQGPSYASVQCLKWLELHK